MITLGPDLKLWGLTLGMTLDVLSSMASSTTAKIPPIPTDLALDLPLAPSLNSSTTAMTPLAPSLSSIFPRFSHWDINGLIWVFGWRYRRLLTLSKASNAIGGVRVNWAGMTLNS